MPLEPGTRLGSCEIVARIGAGGMGEVYRAHDTGLKRDVAIKVLPEEFSRDRERSARLEREAHMLAQMSHPNIGFIHDLKREGDLVYLVLELVPGVTLAHRLEGGALPLREALALFRQIALALEATHARGIIHRDLKPENVKITPEGIVKVLDFGLAKEIFESSGKTGTETQTGPHNLTKDGTIVGTVAYMSPEQARGQPLDKRTDIWSYGCCLFETLSGCRPFQGDSAADVRAAVLKEEPDFGVLPPDVPADIKKLLRRCLRKDVNQRLRDIGDARFVIEEASETPPSPPFGRPPGISPASIALLIGIAFAAGILVKSLLSVNATPTVEAVRRFALELPPTEPMALDTGPALSISSDGSSLVYTVQRGDATELRRRSMDQLEPTRLSGTEGAQGPFFRFSTDELGFFAKSQLYRMSRDDSSPVRLSESPNPRGASWVSDQIVFSPRTESGLSVMSSRSASPTPLTELVLDKGERSHRWPSILPDGKHVLFTCWTAEGFDVEMLNLQSRERKLLVKDGSYARFVPTGHLLFVRDSALMAQAFDPSDEDEVEVVGEPTKMVEDLHFDRLTGAAFYDVSADGTLVYAPREEESDEIYGRLLTLRRDGAARLLNPVSRAYQVPRLSPSGKSLLTILTERGSTDVWSMELGRATMSRITFDGQNGVAVWNPDGNHIAFTAERGGAFNLFSKSIDSSEPERRLTESPNTQFPTSWSPDGRKLAFVEFDPETGLDIWIWRDRGQGGKSEPFQNSTFNESAAVFSPEGRFLAYVSNETGQDEVYVRPADGSSGKWPISTAGGREPVWRGDGAELFYRDEEWMMAVSIEMEGGFEPGAPRPLFEAPFDEAGAPYANYDVSKDGSEFFMVRTDEGREAKRLVVVTNWFSELREQVPVQR
jgi:serine/threonine-protein kinase